MHFHFAKRSEAFANASPGHDRDLSCATHDSFCAWDSRSRSTEAAAAAPDSHFAVIHDRGGHPVVGGGFNAKNTFSVTFALVWRGRNGMELMQ